MAMEFFGPWSFEIIGKNAQAFQQVVIHGSESADGNYPGNVGKKINLINANVWSIDLQWKMLETDPWSKSAIRMVSSVSPTNGLTFTLSADDNVPGSRDGDYDDLIVQLVSLDPELNPKITEEPWVFTHPKDKFIHTGSKALKLPPYSYDFDCDC